MSQDSNTRTSLVNLVIRAVLGGVLMGLANLVPGISGGTMLLAVGIYTYFIDAVAEVTTLKFKVRSIIVLISVVAAAGLGILLLAGAIKELVVAYRWVMYSLFIGLTLGGVPIIRNMIERFSLTVWIAALCGFCAMGIIAWFQQMGFGTSSGLEGNWIMLLVAGIAGASAMILPGISGGYLLLVLGQYIPILSAVDTLKQGLRTLDTALIAHVGVTVILPVGIGIVLGVLGVSNLLRFLLHRYKQATLGVLMGVLLGAVVGLWPFQEGVFFTPTAPQVAAAVGLIAAGFGATYGISRLGGKENSATR